MNAIADTPVFRTRGLGKSYRAGEVEVRALRDVDLDIGRGEFIVLSGPPGSSKSTLLNTDAAIRAADLPDGRITCAESSPARQTDADSASCTCRPRRRWLRLER
jgi:ABC-type lipoprotein export system ATPase subunit